MQRAQARCVYRGLDDDVGVDNEGGHVPQWPARDRRTARTTSGIGSPVSVRPHGAGRGRLSAPIKACRSASSITCCVPTLRALRRPDRIQRLTVSGSLPTFLAASGTVIIARYYYMSTAPVAMAGARTRLFGFPRVQWYQGRVAERLQRTPTAGFRTESRRYHRMRGVLAAPRADSPNTSDWPPVRRAPWRESRGHCLGVGACAGLRRCQHEGRYGRARCRLRRGLHVLPWPAVTQPVPAWPRCHERRRRR